jgi:tRNA G18 (ribose-2'-O)-methylase SpoU
MKHKEIASPENPDMKMFQRLTRARGIKKYGMALMWGPKQVSEVLREFPDRVAGIILTRTHKAPEGSETGDIPFYELSPDLFREIDRFGTGSPVLLIGVDTLPRWFPHKPWPAGCTLCVPFQDPANVGAALRCAAAFGVSRVVILKEAAHPFLPKSIRAAGSSVFRTPLYQGPSLDRITETGPSMITLSPAGRDIRTYRFPRTFCLIPGLEGPGLPAHLRQPTPLSIPMAVGVDSLNAALATGIALYQWRNRGSNLGEGG